VAGGVGPTSRNQVCCYK